MSYRIIQSKDYREGRWRNGLGVSWDIASEDGLADFDWRLAIARIDGGVPFSIYPDIDRIFTIIEGEDLTLDVEGVGRLEASLLQPVTFPGDRPVSCHLRKGPCRALNLFTRRGSYRADVRIDDIPQGETVMLPARSLVFVASGALGLGGQRLAAEDTLHAETAVNFRAVADSRIWRAALYREVPPE